MDVAITEEDIKQLQQQREGIRQEADAISRRLNELMGAIANIDGILGFYAMKKGESQAAPASDGPPPAGA